VSRGLWFVAGAASGAYALVKARRTAEVFTPDGVGARVAALRAGAQVFTSAVAAGMAERESALCAQLDAGPVPHRLIGAGPQPAAAASGPTADDPKPPAVATEQTGPPLWPPSTEGSADGDR
jgi:hypothetical protein